MSPTLSHCALLKSSRSTVRQLELFVIHPKVALENIISSPQVQFMVSIMTSFVTPPFALGKSPTQCW